MSRNTGKYSEPSEMTAKGGRSDLGPTMLNGQHGVAEEKAEGDWRSALDTPPHLAEMRALAEKKLAEGGEVVVTEKGREAVRCWARGSAGDRDEGIARCLGPSIEV